MPRCWIRSLEQCFVMLWMCMIYQSSDPDDSLFLVNNWWSVCFLDELAISVHQAKAIGFRSKLKHAGAIAWLWFHRIEFQVVSHVFLQSSDLDDSLLLVKNSWSVCFLDELSISVHQAKAIGISSKLKHAGAIAWLWFRCIEFQVVSHVFLQSSDLDDFVFCIKKVSPAVLLKQTSVADLTPKGMGPISKANIKRAARGHCFESLIRHHFKSLHLILQSWNITTITLASKKRPSQPHLILDGD